jgi:hypothetical protein
VHTSDDNPDRAALLALELAMREVLEGMQELSLQVAYSHATSRVQVVTDEAPPGPRPTAEVIPFPRLRRAVGE